MGDARHATHLIALPLVGLDQSLHMETVLAILALILQSDIEVSEQAMDLFEECRSRPVSSLVMGSEGLVMAN